MRETNKVIWVTPATLQKFNKRQSELKHRRQDTTVDYLLRFEQLVKRSNKELYEKAKFTLN